LVFHRNEILPILLACLFSTIDSQKLYRQHLLSIHVVFEEQTITTKQVVYPLKHSILSDYLEMKITKSGNLVRLI
jgi:hypothetical protein